MVRFTAAVLVGVLLCAAPALALSASFPSSSTDLNGLATDLPALPVEAASGDAVTHAVDAALGLAQCRSAVDVTLMGWGGRFLGQQDRHEAFLLPWSHTTYVTRQVPVYGLVTERLDGALAWLPVTHQVTRVIGYDTVREAHTVVDQAAVALDFHDTYIEWTQLTDHLFVTLPVGAPFIALGQGVVTQVCDPNAPILDYVPDQDHRDFDAWSPIPMRNAWYVELLSVAVHVASATESSQLSPPGAWLVSGGPIWNAIQARMSQLGPGQDNVSGSTGSADDVAPLTAEAVPAVTPAGSASMAAALAALGTLLSGFGIVAWRRLR